MAGPAKNKSQRATGDKSAQPWFKKRKSRARTRAKMIKNSKRKNRK
jgi:hypothetical protein